MKYEIKMLKIGLFRKKTALFNIYMTFWFVLQFAGICFVICSNFVVKCGQEPPKMFRWAAVVMSGLHYAKSAFCPFAMCGQVLQKCSSVQWLRCRVYTMQRAHFINLQRAPLLVVDTYCFFRMGSSIWVCFLYWAKPSLLDWRLSAMGMLTHKNKAVLATAPAIRYQCDGTKQTYANATPHHIKISPR